MVISKLWSQLRKFIYFQTTKEGVKLRGANVGKKCNKFFSDLRGTSVSIVSKDKRLFSLNAWMGQINRIKINYDAKLILSVHTHWTLFQIGPNTPNHFPFSFYWVFNLRQLFFISWGKGTYDWHWWLQFEFLVDLQVYKDIHRSPYLNLLLLLHGKIHELQKIPSVN